jgi:apoptosis-inducing factor 3
MSQTEAVVARLNELQDGKKRQVTVGDTDILLIRRKDSVYEIGAYCTHNKAPLEQDVLHGDCIVCPWHNAYFDITTGELHQSPGLDSLDRFQFALMATMCWRQCAGDDS